MEFAPKLNRLIGNNILYVADYDKYLFIDILLIQILFYFFYNKSTLSFVYIDGGVQYCIN